MLDPLVVEAPSMQLISQLTTSRSLRFVDSDPQPRLLQLVDMMSIGLREMRTTIYQVHSMTITCLSLLHGSGMSGLVSPRTT
jgi:hypothetical protein